MSAERKEWYDTRQELCITPMEVVDSLNAAVRKLCAQPNNQVAKKYFEDIGAVSQDILIGELACSIFDSNPPPP